MTPKTPTALAKDRRYDLDALRAFAMLLGIGLHASLSFFPVPWPVQDSRQSGLFGVFFTAIHGFRMPLFFLLSGFFTMMMYRHRGLRALLKQRAVRILLPCILGVVTVVPLMGFVSGWAMAKPRPVRADIQQPLVASIRASDVSAVRRCIDQKSDLQRADLRFGIRPLHWASLAGDPEIVQLLIDHGADVNLANEDGNGPLHAAAFLGHATVIELLLQKGADPNALNRDGNPPLFSADAPDEVTRAILKFLELPMPDPEVLKVNREKVRDLLAPRTKPQQSTPAAVQSAGMIEQMRAAYAAFLASSVWQISIGGIDYHLIYGRMFDHLWFLWFLCWMMLIFTMVDGLIRLLGSRDGIARIATWSGLLYWLVPLTIVPQLLMGTSFPSFGPDTSTGVIPQPHLLLYYGLFFTFGVLYFCHDDVGARLGRRWWLLLPIALLVVLPVGQITLGQRWLSAALQPMYAWAMSIGMMGLFRATMNRPSSVIRYISDASYWMYVAHLPLVIGLQGILRDWPVSPFGKFLLINVVSIAVLLISYHLLVRYTWIGRVLNGKRERRVTAEGQA
ncbi:MAG: acyltransferase family protein [Planctomycetota bacterium]